MGERHSLLQRQIKRHLAHAGALSPDCAAFLDAVNEAYFQADADRRMLERSLDLSSQELLEANSELRAVFQAIPDLLFRLDADGHILECQAGKTDDLYRPAAELIGMRIQDVPPSEAGERFAVALADLARGGSVVSFEYALVQAGRVRHYEARILPLRETQRIVLVRNITAHQQAKVELEESLSLLRATLESTADGILVVDAEGQIVAHNGKFAEMWGVAPEALTMGDANRALAQAVQMVARPQVFLRKIRELYAQPDASSRDVVELRDGRVFERYSQPQRAGGESVGRVWSFRDITQQRRAEETIRHRAYHDDLTGLPNRLLFRDRFAQALGHARRHKQMLAMLFMDLDRFKMINDTLGHAVGDKLLQLVSQRLKVLVRAGDTLARMGGDEFMLLVSGIRHVEDTSTRGQPHPRRAQAALSHRRPRAARERERRDQRLPFRRRRRRHPGEARRRRPLPGQGTRAQHLRGLHPGHLPSFTP